MLLEPVRTSTRCWRSPSSTAARARRALGRLYTLLGRHQEALELFEDARAAPPRSAPGPHSRASKPTSRSTTSATARRAQRAIIRAAATALASELGLQL